MPEPLPGRLLVANPLLPDANFDRTVVLVVARNPDGALGVVINRAGGALLEGALPRWAALADEPAVLFEGGPVSPEAIICLVRGGPPVTGGLAAEKAGWSPFTPELSTLDLDLDPGAVAGRVKSLRVFSGYVGWGPGQLEAEIDVGAWWVLEGRPGDAFCARPDQLWTRVLRRQGGSLQLVSSYPDDPAAN